MAYSNSKLVAYTKLSPNHSGARTHSIDRITPHCVVGQCTAEGLGDWFAKSSTQASSNYGIDRDGRVGLYVEEKNRSWCSSSNVFGMKKSLSGNTWAGSSWDGKSVYTKQTREQNADGSYVTITADFRKYPCIEDSIADHSAYLLGAMNGSKKRYAGLKGCTDYKKAVQIIKDGGYATSHSYVSNLCSIIERWNLTQYDTAEEAPAVPAADAWYRVRKSWGDASSQIGAFKVLENAKAYADEHPGYFVFDPDGVKIYAPKTATEMPFLVRVSISDLNIRRGPGTDFAKTGDYTGKGVFTIMEVSSGKGSTAGWGLLKAYAGQRNGWISLDFAEKLG